MNKYLRAVSSNYIFFGINTLFFLIITPIAIRVMGEELYGLWAILNAILLFSGVGMMGMGVVVNKFASEVGEQALAPNKIISATIVILTPMALLVMGLILMLKTWLAKQFGLTPAQEDAFGTALTFTALSIVPQFLGKIPQGYLLSQLKNHVARLIESGVHILIWIGAVMLAYYGKDLAGMALWALGIQILGAGIFFFIVARLINFQWDFEVKNLRKILNFSGYTLIENLAIALFQQFDRILVGLLLGPATAGVYSLATSVGLRITMIVGQASEVMIPYASLNHAKGYQQKLLKTYRDLSKYVSFVSAIITSFLLIWMPEILQAWISPEYSKEFTSIFRIIVLSYGLFTLGHSGRQTLFGMGKIKTISLTYLIASSLMLIAIYPLSKELKITGAGIANVIMIVIIFLNLQVYKFLQGENCFKSMLKDIWLGLLLPPLIFFLTIVFDTILFKSVISVSTLILIFISSKEMIHQQITSLVSKKKC